MQIKGKGNAEFVIAVCDDNPKVRRKIAVILKEKLSQESFWWYVIEFESAEEVLAYSSCHNNSCITLLFLDIEMEGMNGIQLMQQLVDSNSVWRIVFVTNHTENILSSFSIKTIGFIVKPIMVEEINVIIDEWDPIGLFPFAPKDEYLDESQEICNEYKNGMGTKELAHVIYQVFLNSFGLNTFTKPISECEEVAEKIVKSI